MDKELNIKGLNMHSLFRMIAAILMLLISTSSYAALEGKGTEIDPFKIDEPSDLPALRDYIGSNQGKYIYVVQEDDIDLSELSAAAGRPPLPLSSTNWTRNALRVPETMTYFLGSYDGKGHTISNWSIKKNKMMNPVSSKTYYISLFGRIGNATKTKSVVKNLNIEGFDIETQVTQSGLNSIGFSFLASSVVNSEITNCHVKNSNIYGQGHFSFGGIAASNDGVITNCSVKNCSYDAENGAESVGSLCGVNSGTVKNCFAYKVSLIGNEYVGGLVGQQNGGIFENCGFNGQIGAKENFTISNSGGLCGKINKGSFVNCFTAFDNGGNTWSRASVFGGFIGVVAEGIALQLQNCYSFPQILVDNSKRDNVDFFVGRDMSKEDSKKIYESLYCYENAFGEGFVPYLKDGVDFTLEYKTTHSLMHASSDLMRGGCLAEILRDYHLAHLTGENQWREDFEVQNDTLPVFRFMVDEANNDEPFCHPRIYTLSHSENGDISTINGKLKYVTEDQSAEEWVYGLEVKAGNKDWQKLPSVISAPSGMAIDFHQDFKFSKKETTLYRAYVHRKSSLTPSAHGKEVVICEGSSSGPEIVEGCDSVKYDGKWFFPKDNGSYTNPSGEEAIIKIGESQVTWLPKMEVNCGESSVTVFGKTYEKSGVYEISSMPNESGCKSITYQEIKLYPTLPSKDSLKIFTLGEMNYTYSPLSGGDDLTVNVGSEYVLTPTLLIADNVGYSDNKSCDSATINVKYVIPVKISDTEDETWSCKPVKYNGIEYTKDTTIKDTVKTVDLTVPGGMLYELRSHHLKVAVPDTILASKTWCGEIQYLCPEGICTTTEPRFDTVRTASTIIGCQCPSKVTITHHLIGVAPTREETIVSCGSYTYSYRGKTETWKVSGDYVKVRSGRNIGACDNDTTVTYHVTIGESTSYNDTTIHGCGRVVFKTLAGTSKIFTETQDFVDEIATVGGCSAKRTVHVYIHKAQDKSPIVPLTGCAPYTFTKLDGSTVLFEAGNHIVKDTIKSKDACGCDSIVKTTTLIVEDPVKLDTKVFNECDAITIDGVLCTKDTSFVIEKKDPNIFKTCRTQLQPYEVYIGSASVETYYVDTCGVFEKNGNKLTTSGKIEVNIPSAGGCDNKQIYNVRIIEPIRIDSVVYACENYVHKYFDGHQQMVVDDGEILIDKLQSKVCLCDSIIRTVKVYIGNDSHEVLPVVNNCGPYTYVKKSNGQKILIESSQTVLDTLVNKYGCNIYYETEVNIIPVETKIETLDACKEYNSVLPVWNYNNEVRHFYNYTKEVKNLELIFLKTNELQPTCKDTTKLFLNLHGEEVVTTNIVECDTFVYTAFDGTQSVITSDSIIVDTLKSLTCDCDSVILTTNIKINNSIPENMRQTISLRSCDSVVYTNSKGIDMVFTENIQFLDTFHIKNTGCDSVVIVDVIVPKSSGDDIFVPACGDTTLYDEVNDNFPHFFDKSTTWRQILSLNEVGCSKYKDWHIEITPTPRDTVFETGCGELSFRGDTYTSENENAASFSLTVNGATKCDTIHNYMLTVYPKYNHMEEIESCDSVVRNGIVYKQSILFRDTLMSRNNCDSIINVNVIVNQSPDIRDYVFGCNEVKFVDEDYNGGLPVYVHQDSTIYVDKVTEKGCAYQLIQQVQVGHPSSSEEDVFECFDSQKGYATYRDLILTSDTIIYDTVTSQNKCGTVIANRINLIMPVHDTIYVDSCLHITYEGIVYRDSAEVIRQSKTVEMGCDSFTHVMLNVDKCFPYPVLVNKYNWILVCNDNILDEDKFKLKSNVKYNWYKNERLMSTTTDSYFTEDKELNGCYQVGIIVNGGAEYLSDIVCIDENHGYTITPQPNPVEKLQPVTIICDFPVEGVVGTDVEVFNMTADKVYVSKATSNEIVIPGMTISGYYFVRLTTVTGKVLTAKYLVK